ncbi:complex I intermediate-associated protein 30, mitochondrial-like isoform X3 [Mytilus californianus]|uniref:complex I intermediate-associated protein 30, mitochondrial-like isoform X3 n=1 Tax=Mytilus californianus TaxID=6549 RepID=UPI002245D15D|nr:complex I intermediate-associated protein 30, mitochondrial-like isoform X3 [Mytilus californianus]
MMSVLTRQILQLCSRCHAPIITSVKFIHEFDRKGGYNHRIERPVKERIKEGYEIFKKDIKVFGEEMKDKWREDRMLIANHNDYEYFWKFDGAKTLEPWVVTADRDNLEGFSKAEMALSKNNKALFHGYLSQRLPKDGILTSTGYANMRSPLKTRSFQRQESYDWSMFTHLILRVRGDGRPYQLCILMHRYFDVQWFDMYNYTLFTRGGPYWQIAKIPFSKFFLSHKGRILDEQRKIDLDNVRNFGLTLADSVEGPFQLEVDYIGLINDETHVEEFAYEMYRHEFITL